MAANKDKTSKTAHVMNLLSRNRGDAAPSETAAPEAGVPETAAPAAAVPAPAAAPAPAAPILSPVDADAAVSSQIKDALEAELEAAAPAPEPAAPAPQAVPAPPAPQAAAAAPVETPGPETAAKDPMDDANVSYINVMQVLVEEKAEKYMDMFGLCLCDKCQADVKAYALNHLEPKYVVMGAHEMIPKLTFYEMQNSSDIIAQIIKACKVVMSRPHHSRG